MNDCHRVYLVYRIILYVPKIMKQTFTVNIFASSDIRLKCYHYHLQIAACSLALHLDPPLESTTLALNRKL